MQGVKWFYKFEEDTWQMKYLYNCLQDFSKLDLIKGECVYNRKNSGAKVGEAFV